MSHAERSQVLREIRALLVSLQQDGVDFVPRRARTTRSRAMPQRPNSSAASAAAEQLPELPSPAPAGSPAEHELATRDTELAGADVRDAASELLHVRTELGECERCSLASGRRNIVFGEGSACARLVFVGEGPGADEDRTGRPFVGRAGELLTRMIEACGWTRDEVYICNVVKCRPPGNRDPLPPEVAACGTFLTRQLLAIRPEVIVTLGKPAASFLLERPVAITRTRGRWHSWRGIPLMPTYHPAYVLRNYTRETRQQVWDDLRAVHERLQRASSQSSPEA